MVWKYIKISSIQNSFFLLHLISLIQKKMLKSDIKHLIHCWLTMLSFTKQHWDGEHLQNKLYFMFENTFIFSGLYIHFWHHSKPYMTTSIEPWYQFCDGLKCFWIIPVSLQAAFQSVIIGVVGIGFRIRLICSNKICDFGQVTETFYNLQNGQYNKIYNECNWSMWNSTKQKIY